MRNLNTYEKSDEGASTNTESKRRKEDPLQELRYTKVKNTETQNM